MVPSNSKYHDSIRVFIKSIHVANAEKRGGGGRSMMRNKALWPSLPRDANSRTTAPSSS